MDLESKIKFLLGDKDIQILILTTKLEEATRRIEELEKNLLKEVKEE